MPHISDGPIWAEQSSTRQYPKLEHDIHADVVIVGAGITGLTAAIQLQEEGHKVAVIEMSRIGDATTGHSTGHLDVNPDATLTSIRKDFGSEVADALAVSMREAITRVEDFDRKFEINCDFVRVPAYLYTEDKNGEKEVVKEHDTSAKSRLDVRLTEEKILPFPTRLAVRYNDCARFDPLRYIRGLARAFTEEGGQLFEQTRMKDLEEENGACRVTTTGGTLTSTHVIVATHAPAVGLLTLEMRNYPYQSYAIAARVEDDVADALFWDTASPYHYTRRANSNDPKLLIIGGADHHTGDRIDTKECFDQLERYARERYKIVSVEHRWSHEFFEPADGMPYVGAVPGWEHIYIATGFSGDGLKYGTIAADLLTDHIEARIHPLAEAWAPSRMKPLASAAEMAQGLSKAGKDWLIDRVRGGDVKCIDDIEPGEGAVVVVDGKRRAVYRDEQGGVHILSPVCRHMGGIVRWNSAEKTWDCPVHGGRYDAYGKVIMPPPASDLECKESAVASQRRT